MFNSDFVIVLLSILGTIIVAVISSLLTYSLTRKIRLEAEWRKDKLKHYSRLIESITETMSFPKDFNKAYKEYAQTYNIISLIAPQNVANIIFDFYLAQQESWDQEISKEGDENHISIQRQRLKQLVLLMRKDLRINPSDDPNTFRYRLRSPMSTESE